VQLLPKFEGKTMTQLGILHPGQMGISIAASAQNSGCQVYWVSEERSEQTQQRAAEHHLIETETLTDLCQNCEVLVSVCPPHAADAVAQAVIAAGFQGLYVDANAIAPQRAIRMGQRMQVAEIDFVDGGIIGGPAWEAGRTWLYLSGPRAQAVADCFAAGPLETQVIGTEIGKASALKMCFAAYTKGTTALLSGILATAESLGVRQELENQWSRDGSDFASQTQNRVRRATAKAWRFEGEMKEIAATLASTGIPGGFHTSAAEIYRRMADFKDSAETPELEAVLAALLLLPRDGN
jgi:3-hydroxyisobutyrate dehydrogenase-like beta-hydroxyacid dehydrogenase